MFDWKELEKLVDDGRSPLAEDLIRTDEKAVHAFILARYLMSNNKIGFIMLLSLIDRREVSVVIAAHQLWMIFNLKQLKDMATIAYEEAPELFVRPETQE